MVNINVIVARSRNNVIGKNNTIPWHVPEDLIYFKEVTAGYPVIMGFNTWFSIGAKPLPYRENIVITSRPDQIKGIGVKTFSSLRDAIVYLDEKRNEEAFVIGGSRLYVEAMAQARALYLTTMLDIDINYGDVYFDFPEIRNPMVWKCVDRFERRSDKSTTHPYTRFLVETYARVGT